MSGSGTRCRRGCESTCFRQCPSRLRTGIPHDEFSTNGYRLCGGFEAFLNHPEQTIHGLLRNFPGRVIHGCEWRCAIFPHGIIVKTGQSQIFRDAHPRLVACPERPVRPLVVPAKDGIGEFFTLKQCLHAQIAPAIKHIPNRAIPGYFLGRTNNLGAFPRLRKILKRPAKSRFGRRGPRLQKNQPPVPGLQHMTGYLFIAPLPV